MLLLWGAAAIILPIIRAEGIRAVFFPWSMPRQRLAASNMSRDKTACLQSGKDTGAVRQGARSRVSVN